MTAFLPWRKAVKKLGKIIIANTYNNAYTTPRTVFFFLKNTLRYDWDTKIWI